MKTKLSAVALVASAVTIAQANPGGVHAATGGSHRGAVARSAPAVHAPMRPGGVSSFRSTPMRSHGSRPFYSGQRSFLVWDAFVTILRVPAAFLFESRFVHAFRSIHGSNYPATQSCRAIRESQKSSCHTRVEPAKHRNAVPEWKQSTERKQFPECETICGTETISEMETIICVVTGKNTFSLTAQGIGIATGTATATIGGMATNAPSLMDRG